jgi:ammonia channel protein AmtB
VIPVCLQNLVDLAICTLLFWATGWSFTFGDTPHGLDNIIGWGDFFIDSDDVPARWLFQVFESSLTGLLLLTVPASPHDAHGA